MSAQAEEFIRQIRGQAKPEEKQE
jgi:hypothetical protein